MKNGIVRKILQPYLDKFNKLGNKTLARKVIQDNPGVFTDLDHARISIRNARKKDGVSFKDYYDDRFGIKNNEVIPYLPYEVPVSSKRILVLNDIHIPYHEPDVVADSLLFGHEKNIDTIILNGDIIDCYQLSSFVRDPTKRNMKFEVEMTIDFLTTLREAFPKALIIYKFGNHEERWEKYLKAHAAELFDIDEFRLEYILKLKENNIICVKDKRIIKCGKLNIIHGHEYRGGGGVNPARWLQLRAHTNVLCGHFHRASEHISRDMNKDVNGSWSAGCLCELHPEYMPLNDWTHGFTYIEKETNGNFIVDNQKLIKYN